MDTSLRRAWTEIVTGDDLDQHLAAIGQAQAGAELARRILHAAAPPAGGRVVIAGAGTGQMLDLIDPAVLRPFRLTFTDLNPAFLARLSERLARHGLNATILEDDIERPAIEPAPDLLLATLLLEHIDWQRGVEAMAGLRPAACGIVIQENPEGMSSAITPGRRRPPSLAKAFESAHITPVPRKELIAAFASRGYRRQDTWTREVADGKRLVGSLFVQR
ncbi:MAG: class I SAM-dependent methyltransferase [Bryobacteraceae bacterium]